MTILGLEVSTTSLKAMLFDELRGATQIVSEPYAHLPGQYGSCDADTIFAQLLKIGRGICEGHRVDCVVLSCTWHSLLLCDTHLRPVGPMYLWCSDMAAAYCREKRRNLDAVRTRYARTGALGNPCYPYYKLGRLRELGIDLSDKCIGGNGSYFNYRMAGCFAESLSMISGSGLFDLHERRFADDLLLELGLSASQMPKILPPGTVLALNQETAQALGVLPGTPFIPAMPDGALDQIGADAMGPSAMTFSVGTSASFRFHSSKAIISPDLSTWCYLAPDGSWLSGIGTSGSCNCIDWIRHLLFGAQTSYAQIEQRLPEDIYSAPFFLPFLFGERGPGWDDGHLGSFQELRSSHTRYDLYYAVIEGTLFNIMQCYACIRAMNGSASKTCLSGGILNSPRWLRMCLDFFQMPMYAVREKHSSLLGGILLGAQLTDPSALAQYESKKPEAPLLRPHADAKLLQQRYKKYLDYYQKLKLEN